MGFKYIKPVTESQLQASIQGERDNAYKESVGSAIQDEINERIACDTAIITAYTDADNVITANLAAETSARQNADTNIRSDFQAADTNITASLAAESAARRDGDNLLTEKIGLQSVQINNLGTSLDTTAAALGNESENRTEQFKTVGDAINAEVNARAAADAAIQASIGSINDRLTADSTISGALNNEISTRENQTASLSSAISAERTARISADDSLSAAIQTEKTARIDGDNSLKSIFDTAVADYKNADSTLKTYVDNTVTNLIASDTNILTALNNEVTLRANQTSSLASALNAEVNLQAQHYTELKDSYHTALSAISGESVTRQLADDALNSSIVAAVNRLNAFYQEFSNRVPMPPEIADGDTDTVYYLTNKGWGEPIETRIKIGATPSQIEVPRYSGQVITPLFDNYSSDALSISSETTATNAGTYTIVFTPNEGYMWADGTQDPRRVTWKILPKITTIPIATSTSFEYNGGNITLPVSGYDSDCSTQTGTANATNVGTYTAKYELKNTQNYIWSDNTTAAKTISWKITVKSIAKPTISNTVFDYDGNNHAPTITGYAADYMSQSGTTSAINAGSYSVVYALKDTVNTQWTGGGTGDVTLNWTINRKKLTAAQSTFTVVSPVTYNGKAQTPQITGIVDTLHTWYLYYGGVNWGHSVETAYESPYQIIIRVNDNYAWNDGTTSNKTLEFKIDKAILPKPTLKDSSLPYSGSNQSVVINNNSELLTQSGNTSAINVGTYLVTFKLPHITNHPQSGFAAIWEDGTTDDVTLNWSIVKGAGLAKPTLNANSFEWTGGSIAPTINGFNSSTMTKTGTESATDINSYSITVSLKDKTNTAWADGTTADVVLTWSITKRTLTKPTLATSSYDYNGSAKTVTINNFNSTYMNKSGTESSTNAGSYSVTISLKNTTTCQWSGGGTANVVLNWTINRAKLTAAQSTFSQSGTLTYNGNSQNVSISGYSSTYHDLSSTTSATNAGTYTAKIAPKSNYCFSDGSTAAKSVTWTVAKLSLTAPTLTNSTYTYDGNNHSPTINNFNSTYENQTGTTNTATAGTYTVTFSLKDTNNTQWSGGSTANVERSWTINKATPTLTLSATSVTLDNDSSTTTVTATFPASSSLTATSADTDTATVSVSGSSIKLTGKGNYGDSVTITVSVTESTNYTAKTTTLTVLSKFVAPLKNCTWTQVQKIIADGKAATYWSVGDYKEVVFRNVKMQAFILGFDHKNDFYQKEETDYEHYVDFCIGKNVDGVQVASYTELSYYGKYVNNSTDTTTTAILPTYQIRENSKAWQELNCTIKNYNSANGTKDIYDGNNQRRVHTSDSKTYTVNDKTFYSGGTLFTSYVLSDLAWCVDQNTSNNFWMEPERVELLNAIIYPTKLWDAVPEKLPYKFWCMAAGENTCGGSDGNSYTSQYEYFRNGNSGVFYKINDTATQAAFWARKISYDNNEKTTWNALCIQGAYDLLGFSQRSYEAHGALDKLCLGMVPCFRIA